MDLSICLPTYNSLSYLRQCLEALGGETAGLSAEIIVVDNGSADGTSEFVGKNYPGVRLLREERNVDYARACNLAMKQSRGDYLLLISDDVMVKPGAIGLLLSYLKEHPAAGAAAGKLLNPDGTVQVGFNLRQFPSLRDFIFESLLVDRLWPGNPQTRRYQMLDHDYGRVAEVDQPAAALLMVRAGVARELDYFDEQLVHMYNDVDLCQRIKRAGWGIVFLPGAEATHYGSVATKRLGKINVLPTVYHDKIYYSEKYFGPAGSLFFRLVSCLGLLVRAGLAAAYLKKDRAWSYLKIARYCLLLT